MFTFVTSCCSPHISTSQQKSSTECLIWCHSGCVRILPFHTLRELCLSTVSMNHILAVLEFNLFNRNRTKRHLICIQQVPGRSKVTWGRPLERRGALWVLFRIQNVNHRQQCILMGLIFVSLFKTLRLVVLLEVHSH